MIWQAPVDSINELLDPNSANTIRCDVFRIEKVYPDMQLVIQEFSIYSILTYVLQLSALSQAHYVDLSQYSAATNISIQIQ